jgi:hypothetical protein
MDTTTTEIPTIPGTAFAGGFYAGRILVGGIEHVLIVAPKSEGEAEEQLNESGGRVADALSFCDGYANTLAFDTAGSDLAKWARGLRIGGFDDWYLPSRDELEILYRAFKPTTAENYCYRGDNPSSVPVGYAYMPDSPGQTTHDAFRARGAEAFEAEWYWSSTQCAGVEAYAWCQYFGSGSQGTSRKDDALRARAVRRLKI